jgi:excisionase family DNA binding protein
MELLRASRAAKRLGINPVTLRRWSDEGKIPATWVGRERRFSTIDLDAFMVRPGGPQAGERLEGLYVRVSGASGQETSLAAQEAELRGTATGTVARVFRDRASGLREDRPGPEKMLAAVACG